MSDAETGVYITLIATMYEMAAPIERNDDRLYRVCGSKSKASFVKSLNYLMSEGKIIETEEGLFNEKVSKVIQQTIEKSDKAKAAAQSRWDRKPSKNKGSNDADACETHMPEGCQLELEPELYKKEDTDVSLSLARPNDDIGDAFNAYNEMAERLGLPVAKVLSKTRAAGIKARLKDAGGIDGWRTALAKTEASPHCNGANDRGWRADLDFLLQQKSFTRLMEGSYDDRTSNTQSGPSGHTRRGNGHDSLMAGFAAAANQGRD